MMEWALKSRGIVWGLAALLLSGVAWGQGTPQDDSGGVLTDAQASYDVRFYDLSLSIDPEKRRIDGQLVVRCTVLKGLRTLVLDLDDSLKVESVTSDGPKKFVHEKGRIRIDLGRKHPAGTTLLVAVLYGGVPRVALMPPWEGGFTWSKTPTGEPWIATTCQMNGADLWWPCKDHPSDEPDEGMTMHFRLPRPLIAASNGRLERTEDHDDGTRTFHWRVTTPINNYCIALNAAPYEVLKTTLKSVAGDTIPIEFYALPANAGKAKILLDEVKDHLRFFEDHFGPYPFRRDKYGVAETPHLGMEHQTIIAYGYGYKKDRFGIDWLHHHELAHEWWGNLVTAPDWKDFWIHEGFGTYCQGLYIEKIRGAKKYRDELRRWRRMIANRHPVAPAKSATARAMSKAGPGLDVYYKGAWVLHTLRWVIGKDALIKSMRELCYPNAAAEKDPKGNHCHFSTTEDFIALCEKNSGQKLNWFFDLYLRQPKLAKLEREMDGRTLHLRWDTPGDLPFPMPVAVKVGDEIKRVEMPKGKGSLRIPKGVSIDPELDVDPERWILRRLGRR